MLSHISLGVAVLSRSGRFYDALLGPLGIARVWSGPSGIGYGTPGGADRLALFPQPDADRPLAAGPGFHLAFFAPNNDTVDRAYAAALAIGGSDAGPPGPRPRYGPGYYAAFVRDPDGHKLELKARDSEH
ncbi:MAG: catechol 2,3-dioxygenase-like lactoylglutathione lyase family enzyme [Myxococcota bacterium]|jgi:catechol 2,3-dioxygenase-like lactoylglutathione lyase family enzyme